MAMSDPAGPAMTGTMTLPRLALLARPGGSRGRSRGAPAALTRPWIFANEIDMQAATALPA